LSTSLLETIAQCLRQLGVLLLRDDDDGTLVLPYMINDSVLTLVRVLADDEMQELILLARICAVSAQCRAPVAGLLTQLNNWGIGVVFGMSADEVWGVTHVDVLVTETPAAQFQRALAQLLKAVDSTHDAIVAKARDMPGSCHTTRIQLEITTILSHLGGNPDIRQ